MLKLAAATVLKLPQFYNSKAHRDILSDGKTASEINSDILNYTVSMLYFPVFNILQFVNNGSLFLISVTGKTIKLIHMTT